MPLSRQASAILAEIRSLTGKGKYVFPSIRNAANPMSENAVNARLRRLGYSGDEMTAHGFRSVASTLPNACGKWHPDAIERALAHKDRDSVRAAYARGAFWNERVEMAQWWSDYLYRLEGRAEGTAPGVWSMRGHAKTCHPSRWGDGSQERRNRPDPVIAIRPGKCLVTPDAVHCACRSGHPQSAIYSIIERVNPHHRQPACCMTIR